MLKKKARITPLDWALMAVLLGGLAYVGYRVEGAMDYDWNWSVIPQYLLRHDPERGWVPNLLLQGLLTTIRLSFWATILATLLGTVMGLCRVSSSLFLRLIGRTYVESVRNLPPLVLIFICYFFLADQLMTLLHVEDFIRSRSPATQDFLAIFLAPPSQFTSFLSALFTVALYEGAYITEIVRAGVQSVERGIWEASHALGLTRWQNMRHVILPLTAQRVVPPLAGQFISTIKDSAIISVISVPELTFQGLELMASTYRTFEIWITIAGLYLVLTLSCSLGARRLEAYLNRSEA